MQGWLFVNNPKFWQPPQAKALFDAVPNERMVVLDLYCEAAAGVGQDRGLSWQAVGLVHHPQLRRPRRHVRRTAADPPESADGAPVPSAATCAAWD